MRDVRIYPSIIAMLWAGLLLGGSLIAAPAKFTVSSLDMATALEVGRAQFGWLAIGEYVLLAALFGFLFVRRHSSNWRWFLLPVTIFLVQRFALMPSLDVATLSKIAGNDIGSGNLHTVYVVLEVAKCISLIVAAILSLNFISGGAHERTAN